MTIAIHTKYIGPSDVKGARISATCSRLDKIKRVIVGLDHGLDGTARHALAARELLAKHFGYLSEFPLHFAGETIDGKGYVFTVQPQVEE